MSGQATLTRLLEPYIADGNAGEQVAAEIFETSVKTLRRRLAEAGTSYREILASARFNVARRLLGDRDMRLIDVAQSLGYRDPGSFSRAFRAWSGLTPRAYRSRSPGPDT